MKLDKDNFPIDWERKTLKDIGSFSKGSGVSGDQMRDIGIPCVGYGDLYMKYDTKFCEPKSFLAENAINKSVVAPKGTLFFTATGETAEEIGKCVCYYGEEPIYVGGDIFILDTKEVNPLFVAYQQNLHPFIKQKARYGQGHSVVHICKDNLEKLSLAYPPNPKEQEKIVKILMKWDEAIEQQELLIGRLKAQKKAHIGIIIKPKDNWIKISLKKVLDERKEYCEKSGEYPHVTLAIEGISDKTERYERDFLVAQEDKQYRITHFNDICYNPANLKFGTICINRYGDAIFSPIYVTFTVNKDFNPDFIGSILTSQNFIEKVRRFEEGTLYERQAVKPRDFIKENIYIPPTKDEQDNIAKAILLINDRIISQVQKLNLLKRQRKALMQQLLTGAVRVNV